MEGIKTGKFQVMVRILMEFQWKKRNSRKLQGGGVGKNFDGIPGDTVSENGYPRQEENLNVYKDNELYC